MDDKFFGRTRRLVEGVEAKLPLENIKTLEEMLFYIAELEEKLNNRSFCPYCGKGLTTKNS